MPYFTPVTFRLNISSSVSAAVSAAGCLQDDKGKSKCFGFINYADTDAAGKAVEALTGDY
jgi:RNA recognition motif-containing protein